MTYVAERLGRLPEIGETIEIDGMDFEIVRAGPAQIEELRGTFPPRSAPVD